MSLYWRGTRVPPPVGKAKMPSNPLKAQGSAILAYCHETGKPASMISPGLLVPGLRGKDMILPDNSSPAQLRNAIVSFDRAVDKI